MEATGGSTAGTQVVDGRQLAHDLRAELRAELARLGGVRPCLAAVLVGDDPASRVYVRGKRRGCQETGLDSILVELPATTPETDLLAEIDRLNRDPGVHGILVQLPLPAPIDPGRIAQAVDPRKDVDGLHPENVGKLVANRPALYPGTPLGCIEILDRYRFEIEGRHAVVIGRSEIVGKPVALLLLHRHATVTLCHSRTRDLPGLIRQADILVAALGKPRFVQGEWIKPGAAVIDVGVNRIDGKIVGDVDFEKALGRAGLLTPVPGGVGLLTITMVLRNTLRAFELQQRR
jgi:methylenetetrahydrofolate dehydrogenase (NADP+)/methenyltetrahydrofolate cyclohydrolase